MEVHISREIVQAFNQAMIQNEKKKYINVFLSRSSLIINVDDINEYAPVFTHNNYLFKLHQDQTCDSSSCRVS